MSEKGDPEILAILGSARRGGNTAAVAEHLRHALSLSEDKLVDLLSCRIEPFRYHVLLRGDDFTEVVEQMLRHRHIIFVTPVYWYAMSGLMKVFFDRLTDLLTSGDGRRMGRALAGRHLWLVATGTDEELPLGFQEPFRLMAEYFSMLWRGAFYVQLKTTSTPTSLDFASLDELISALKACP